MSDPFLGEIRTVGFNFAPVGWSTCAGQILSISQNSALFSLLGTMYGGNGTTNFQLPNLQGRVAIDVAQGVSGLANYVQGQVGGTEQVTLTQQQLPTHTHTATFTPSGGGSATLAAVNAAATTGAATAGYQLANAQPSSGVSAARIYAPAGSGTAVNLGGISGGGATGGTVTNALAGQSLPTPILQPYLVLLNIIAMQGVYPSRG